MNRIGRKDYMLYQEFVYAVEERVNRKLEGGVKASLYTATKNNGRQRQGMMIEYPGINISPTIYLEEFYERYQNGKTLDDIVKEILEYYEKIRCRSSWDASGVLDYEKMRKKIMPKLIHTDKNKELLCDVPHQELLDMSIVFYVLMDLTGKTTATMLVRNSHMREWGTDKETLYEDAKKNAGVLMPAQLFPMRKLVEQMLEEKETERINLLESSDYCEIKKDYMYVLTNPCCIFGAACIAYPHVLEMVGEVLGEDFYILPSSIHETILVPASCSVQPDELNQMICEINATQVAAEEVLSDHCYYYDRAAKKVTMNIEHKLSD